MGSPEGRADMSSDKQNPAANVSGATAVAPTSSLPRSASNRFVPFTLAIVLAVAGAAAPSVIQSTLVFTLLTQATISAILATSVGFLIRQNGLVSFGHAAFYGLAGYIIALSMRGQIASPEAAIGLAVVIPTLLAFGLGMVFIRMVGVAFSMLTLAVAQAFYELFMRWRGLANGEDGLRVDWPASIFGVHTTMFQDAGTMFIACWFVLVLVVFGLYVLASSHFGTLTLAIRENEERVRFIGYATVVPRAIVYAISAFIASLAGVLFTLYNGFVTPDILSWSLSGEIMVMAIIGGTRSIWGQPLEQCFSSSSRVSLVTSLIIGRLWWVACSSRSFSSFHKASVEF
ncbi:branched-chain amino acid ABC transporter permease [Paraburkholderia dipogonis]|uniref:Branched-chain amino acid ABC transporter permease n=2 Tax=Paraburkholderia dipogonis TaxID=1211383 RepID=A0A4Y8MGA8_9BURK|nr:branched-chain amino acid ABC transporter permease [Paraburkholderia dipogonis]